MRTHAGTYDSAGTGRDVWHHRSPPPQTRVPCAFEAIDHKSWASTSRAAACTIPHAPLFCLSGPRTIGPLAARPGSLHLGPLRYPPWPGVRQGHQRQESDKHVGRLQVSRTTGNFPRSPRRCSSVPWECVGLFQGCLQRCGRAVAGCGHSSSRAGAHGRRARRRHDRSRGSATTLAAGGATAQAAGDSARRCVGRAPPRAGPGLVRAASGRRPDTQGWWRQNHS